MSSDSIFNSEAAEPTKADPAKESASASPNTSTPTPDKSSPFLVVGDRAFHTPDDVTKKIVNADEHIGKLEAETAMMRTRLQEMEERISNNRSLNDVLDAVGDKPKEQTTSPNFDPKDLDKLVRESVQNLSAEQVAKNNLASAQAAYASQFDGDFTQAAKALTEQCAELGMSLKQAEDLARSSPNGFLKMFGTNPDNQPKSSPAPAAGSPNRVNTAALEAANRSANQNPRGYTALKQAWKEAKSPKDKAFIMSQIDEGARSIPNFMQT